MKTPILLVLAACGAPSRAAQSPRIDVVPAQLPVADEAQATFKGWKIVKDEVVEDTPDRGMRKTKLVRFIAEKP